VATYLLRAADTTGVVEITQAQLASMLGAQRTSVQPVLKNLEDAGLVEVGYRRVELVDAAGLASLLRDT
jgi:Mn-dependent DtxR family transcriptional regulator